MLDECESVSCRQNSLRLHGTVGDQHLKTNFANQKPTAVGLTDAICYQTRVIFELEFQTKYEQNQKMPSILTNIRRAEGTSPLSLKHQMDL